MKYLLIVFISFTLISFNLYAQDNFNFRKTFIEAQRHLQLDDFDAAKESLLKIYKNDSSNANVNYLIAWCCYNSEDENIRKNSINFFNKSLKSISKDYKSEDYKETNAPCNSYMYLAEMYHENYMFAEAINMFEKYRPTVIDDFKKIQELDKKIEISSNAKKYVSNPVKIKINNLTDVINSESDDHSPVINADETMMVFTSKREGSTGELKTYAGEYYEDIYVAYKEEGKWVAPEKISANINTYENEATIGLSADGTELFIYRDDVGVGNIYLSTLNTETKVWSIPVKLGSNINTQYDETHATISPDGQTLYFVSNRPGGFGGSDIYMVKRLPDGSWGWAQNLGDVVNTNYNEDGPFMHQDGYTLYYSSKGHSSMGGFDLFYSTLKDDSTFTEPVNFGYPINTINDDIFYVLSTDGKRAYYSTEKKDGIGGKDIYMMDLLSLPERSFVVVSGVLKNTSNETVKDIFISVSDAETGRLIGKYRPNPTTGKYLLVVERGRAFVISDDKEEVLFEKNEFSVSSNRSFFYSREKVNINPLGIIK